MQRRKLNYAERWLREGVEVNRPPAFFESVDVDMSNARALLAFAREREFRLTYSPLLVRATALALARHQDLHVLLCGNRVYSPGQVDVSISVAGDAAVAPVLIIENANGKNLVTIAQEMKERVRQTRADDQRLQAALKRWGWVLPFSILRRFLLRTLNRTVQFRRKASGTFQVTMLSGVDAWFAPMFSSSGILAAGRVRDAVIAVDGKPAVRPVMTLTCAGDHRIWDGRAGERILLAVRHVLEGHQLLDEFKDALAR